MYIEIWKAIEGYEGLYQVSTEGQVRSLGNNKSRKTKILKQSTDSSGYKQIGLHKNGKCKTYLVHRLVAQTFIPNPNNLPQVNHKDEDKINNHVSNLEWCTQEYNNNYGTHNQRVIEANKEKNGKPILMFTLDGEFIRRFNSVADANEYCGKHRKAKNINTCARGYNGQQTAYGYIFKYEKDCK